MQNLLSLNELYANYTDGLIKKHEFESAIFRTVQDDINRFGMSGWSKEDYDDYISGLYPRISRAIDTYQDTGSSFETFIASLIRMTAKEYRSRQIRNYMEETAAWIAHIPDLYASENEAEYDNHDAYCESSGAAETTEPTKPENPRQLLILILKCCSHVSLDFLEKVSPKLGIDLATLNKMIDELKQMREKRETEFTRLRERVNRQFYRCILFERKLKFLAADSIAAERTKKQLEQGRERLTRTRRQLARKRMDPSNRQIAKLLGISKGTVDTVLYTLKTRPVVSGESSAPLTGASGNK